MSGEGGIDARKDGEEMCLERLNCLLGLVATVHVRWDLLMCAFPYVCDGMYVGCTGFIVEDLHVNVNATCLESFHDGFVGWDAMVVRFGLKGFPHRDKQA